MSRSFAHSLHILDSLLRQMISPHTLKHLPKLSSHNCNSNRLLGFVPTRCRCNRDPQSRRFNLSNLNQCSPSLLQRWRWVRLTFTMTSIELLHCYLCLLCRLYHPRLRCRQSHRHPRCLPFQHQIEFRLWDQFLDILVNILHCILISMNISVMPKTSKAKHIYPDRQ